MKNIRYFILAIFVLGFLSFIQAQTVSLNANEFEKKLSSTKDKTVLDVRTAEEFSQGHLSDAVMIDFYQADFKDRVSKLDKSKPVFVYCLGGGRSSSASKIMKDLGFSQVYNLEGGFKEWKSAGKKIVK